VDYNEIGNSNDSECDSFIRILGCSEMKTKKYIVNAMGMHSSKYGGLEKFLVFLADELCKHNISLIVVYNSEPHVKEFSNDIIQAGGKVVKAHAMHPMEYLITFIKLFVKYKPILVHAHFQIYYSIVFARLLGCKKIFATFHGMYIDKNSKYIDNTKQIAPSTRLFRKIVNKFTDRFFAVSNAVKEQYTLLFPGVENKIETLYLGSLPNNNLPGLCRRKINTQPDKVIIGVIGFNSPVKGLDILMDALVLLKNEFNCTDFLVCQIGIDSLDPCNKDFIDEYEQKGIADLVQWMGIRNDVPELLPGMDIYCQPSRSEALPLAIMEAGMAGLPVVGSRVGGIPEIVLDGHSGFLFENSNVNQLAECLFMLIKDPDLRRKMGKNSREHIMKNFNIQTQARAICSKYLTELKLN
jgi:glycosyltransferase involved in cell wall biosynthesis